MKFLKCTILLVLFLASFAATAQYSIPKNQADIDQKAYLNSVYAAPGIDYYVWFWEEGEQLVRSFTQTATQGTTGLYYYSDSTRIAYSTIYNGNEVKMNYICPTGQTDKVKRHINIMKTWDTQVGHIYVTKPACPTAPTQPKPNLNTSVITNSTTEAQIQAIYGPNFTVKRLISTRDIFSVRCTVSQTSCDYWDELLRVAYPTEGVVYYSNTQKIGLRKFSHSMNAQYVMVRDRSTVTSQTAKDDITFLTTTIGVEGQPWSWVDNNSDPAYTFWFN